MNRLMLLLDSLIFFSEQDLKLIPNDNSVANVNTLVTWRNAMFIVEDLHHGK